MRLLVRVVRWCGTFVAFALAFVADANTVWNSYAYFEGVKVSLVNGDDFCYDQDATGGMVVTARPGWLIDGAKVVTLSRRKNMGHCLRLQTELKEDKGWIHVFPYFEEDGHHVTGNPVLISARAAQSSYVAMYAAPETSAKVSISLIPEVVQKGKHVVIRKWYACSCGKACRSEEIETKVCEVEPNSYTWTVLETGERLKGGVWSGSLGKNKEQDVGTKLKFAVIGESEEFPDCAYCTGKAETEVVVDVFELSLNVENEYIGLDMTDAKKNMRFIGKATAKIDPVPSMASYKWIDCGKRCSWASSDSNAGVSFYTTCAKGPSEEYREEPLVVKGTVRKNGQEASVTCMDRFTIVKVDATLDATTEEDEETKGALVRTCMIKNDTGDDSRGYGIPIGEASLPSHPSDRQRRNLSKLTVKVIPELPRAERLKFEVSSAVSLYSVSESAGYEKLNPQGYGAAENPRACDAANVEYAVCGCFYSQKVNDGVITVRHENSGAVDRVCLTSYGFKVITPGGDPVKTPKASTKENKDNPLDGQNEFTFYDVGDTGRMKLFVKAQVRPAFSAIYLSSYEDIAERLKGKFTVAKLDGKTPFWHSLNGCVVDENGSVQMNSLGMYEAVAVFDGYPDGIEGFGRKEMTFAVDGRVLKRNYEVFYDKCGFNHPQCTHEVKTELLGISYHEKCKDGKCPNWFYYWQKHKACIIPNYFVYGGARDDLWGACFKPNEWVCLYDRAATVEFEKVVKRRKHVKTKSDGRRVTVEYPAETIGADRKGLACCAAIVAHEVYHGTLAIKSQGKADLDPPNSDANTIGDQIADSLESNDAGIATSIRLKDTYNMKRVWNWPDYAKSGDNEVRARKIERNEAKKWYDEKLDWSNPGFQSAELGAYDKCNE